MKTPSWLEGGWLHSCHTPGRWRTSLREWWYAGPISWQCRKCKRRWHYRYRDLTGMAMMGAWEVERPSAASRARSAVPPAP